MPSQLADTEQYLELLDSMFSIVFVNYKRRDHKQKHPKAPLSPMSAKRKISILRKYISPMVDFPHPLIPNIEFCTIGESVNFIWFLVFMLNSFVWVIIQFTFVCI